MSTSGDSQRNIVKRRTGADAASPPTGRRSAVVVKRAVVEARAEARRLLDEAEREAADLRERATTEARELREAAYREGHEAALLELNQLLLEAHARRDAAFNEAERDVLRLAIKLAEKIIGREIKGDPATLADIVTTALAYARQHKTLLVRVHPADLAEVRARRDLLEPAGHAGYLDLVPDPRVGRGGCIIESEAGTVDAQLDTQLRVLERALLERASGDTR